MTSSWWRLAGGVWVAVMTLAGLGVVLFPIIFPPGPDNDFKGQGTAMLLVAASILFAVVFATWDWEKKLAAFASFSTAVFGFLGTSYILAEENASLLAVLGIVTFYSAGTSILLAPPMTVIFRSIRRRMSQQPTDEDAAINSQIAVAPTPTAPPPVTPPPPEYRTGIGIDAHPLTPGISLILGGVPIPHHHGLAGHSDGDVLTHALLDALLGAANLGDKGAHFPSTDPQYRGISSLLLLQQVAALLHAAGWRIANIDATILAQTPRLGPYIPTMKERTAAALSLAPGRVSIKATTTDYLGFIGRTEGIAALAIAALIANPDAPPKEPPAAPPSSAQ